MKKLVIGIMCGLIAVSTAASAADQIIQIERPEGIPSFLGNVPDEFVLVLKPDVNRTSGSWACSTPRMRSLR